MSEAKPYNQPGMDDYIQECAHRNSALIRKTAGPAEVNQNVEAKGQFAPCTGSVPDGFTLLNPSDFFCAGDIVADCEGKWRGPIPLDSDMVGREIRSYLCASTGLPPVRAAARRSPNR